jgi:tRNA dimethylallyltransferase
MNPRPPLVIIVGPTAVGKTELSIQLARRINGEIISADSRLFYRGMDIGTAKPSQAERGDVPHHLIDIANPDETISLPIFQQLARQAIAEVQQRGHLPLLVGGTGQYIRAVVEGWSPPPVQPNARLRLVLEKMATERGYQWLHDRLRSLDAQAAEKIDPRNVRRTIRALEVILLSGHPFSAQRQQGESPYNTLTIGLNRPRPELYARVDARIEAMFAGGLLEEVRGLLEKGYSPNLPALSAIGYQQAIRVVNGQMSADQAKVEMRRATRVFIRRQANWFRQSDAAIHWFQAGDPQVVENMEQTIRTWLHDHN